MSDHEREPLPRRDFVRGLTLGALAAVPGSGAIADEPKAKEKEKDAPKPPEPLSELDARMALIVAKYGKHKQLDAAALAAIKRDVAGVIRLGDELRKVKLSNGDGPYPVFTPYRAPLEQ